MKLRIRFYFIFFCLLFLVFFFIYGNQIDLVVQHVIGFQKHRSVQNSIILFFTILNLNVLIILYLVYIIFRSGVQLIVNRSNGVFGSKLNTKLIIAFLFFSLLPTVVLLYVSTKFMNTNFDKLLQNQGVVHKLMDPQAIVEYKDSVHALQMSYYILLVVVVLLILFSASWLGFTIAKEITTPIQFLADATESVAKGNYDVHIDDIVSDDEMGILARSFAAMLKDLRVERERVIKFSTELKNKVDYNELLLQNINTAVISLDDELKIESWNHLAFEIFHLREEVVRYKYIQEVLPSDLFQNAIFPLVQMERANEKRQSTSSSLSWTGNMSEQDRQLQISIKSLSLPAKKEGYLLFIHDLTELAKAQRLAAWREVAKRIAHEIKNPLTPIKLGAQRLEKKFANQIIENDKQTFFETIKIITQTTDSIRRLVDEFIEFSRMPQPNLIYGNIVEAIYLSFTIFTNNEFDIPIRLLIRNADIKFILENDINHPQKLPSILCRFDKDQITRLFTNLISNAINASQEGRQLIEICVEQDNPKEPIVIEVKDLGQGMSSIVKRQVFEPYFSTKKTGMGLGLVIVKQIVAEHMGRIDVFDNTPHGSVFRVEIPVV